MKYTYNDMPDKTKEGVMREVSSGLGELAFKFFSVYGVPIELFQEMLDEYVPTNTGRIQLYFQFKNGLI